jgi:4-hydroxy-2-oxoglutarate aldolase
MGGSADFTIQTLIGGGSGVICGLANVTPKACVKLIDLYKVGRFHESQTLQAAVARGDWAAIKGGVVGTKSALMAYFGYGGYGRRPLPRPTKQEALNFSHGFQELVGIEKML